MTPGTDRRATLAWALLLVVAAVATFAGNLDGELVFDDRRALLGVRYVETLWPPWHALWAEQDLPVAGRPLSSLSLAVNHALGGLEVRGYHVVNLAIHAGCVLLLFGVVRRTLRRPRLRERWAPVATPIAGASALLWAVHPLQTECAAYVIARTESLMALFYLGTFYAAIRADEQRPGAARSWTALSVVLCFAGVLSKEAMVSAPLLLVLYDWTFRDEDFAAVARRRRPLWAGLAASWLLLAVLVASGSRTASVGFDLGVSPLQYLWNQAAMLVEYGRLVFWPDPLLIHYGFARDLAFGDVWARVVLLGGLFLASVVGVWRSSPWGFLGIWVFAILAPTSSFVPITTEVGSERRMYLPLAAFAVALPCLVAMALERLSGDRRVRLAVGGLLLAAVASALVLTSRARSLDFRTREALWRAQVEDAPEVPQGWFALARVLDERGELERAAELYVRALHLAPDYLDARVNLGVLRWKQGKRYEARRQFEDALRRHGQDPSVLANLGLLAQQTGRFDRAIERYEQAIALDPAEALALTGLAEVLTTHPDPARRDFARAAELAERAGHALRFGNLRALEAWSAALAAQGKADEALRVAIFAAGLAHASEQRVEDFDALLEQRRAEAATAP